MTKLTFYDKLFIVLLLVVSLGLFLFNFSLAATSGRKYLTVQVNNELVLEHSFDEQTEEVVNFSFGDNHEHEAVLEIKGGAVRMLPLDKGLCPQGICSHMGWISKNYQSIVCVPNRIVVSFSDKNLGAVDGVTY